MEYPKDQIMQALSERNMLNTSNDLKPFELIEKRRTCLECRAKKNNNPSFLNHVKTRHLEKSVYLLAKECY